MSDTVYTTAPTIAHSPSLAKFAAALASFQAEMGPIARSQNVSTGKYSFDFAPLDCIVKAMQPLLSKAGLSFVQPATSTYVAGAEQGRVIVRVTTIVLHTSGEYLASTFEAPALPAAQQLGQSISYLRRYCLLASLGLVQSDEDDSGENTSIGEPTKPATQREVAKSDDARTKCFRLAVDWGGFPKDDLSAIGAFIRQCAKAAGVNVTASKLTDDESERTAAWMQSEKAAGRRPLVGAGS